jgi:Na+/H+-dicarboxylate symporter
MKFFVTVVAALSFHSFVVLSVLLIFMAKVNPFKLIKAVMPALLTAFSTSSSSASLPITIECVEKNVGVSNQVSSFVLPLGATVNMNGTALYEGMVAIFIAQTFGVTVSFEQQILVLIIALLTSVGVAGIPSASIIAISIILTTIGLPLEAVGIIMVTDRVLDMCRTTVNIYGDACGAVIIANSMGEKNNLKAIALKS